MKIIEETIKQAEQTNLIIKIRKLEKEGHLSSFFVHSFLEYLQRNGLNEEKSK